MNIHQLRAICEVVKQGLRMSTAAETLFRSQPGISRQIREIEEEIGVQIFRRKTNKIEALTPAGHEVVRVAERILQDIESLRLIGKEYSANDVGDLTVATTHTQARYSLPGVVEAFTKHFPGVRLTLRQGDPIQCCEMVVAGKADMAITTATSRSYDDLISVPVYQLTRCIVAPFKHPILKEKRLTLEKLSQYPIITFGTEFSGGWAIEEAFARAGIKPNVVLSAVDADVTKAYVERGLGIAVLATVAFDPVKDKNLRIVGASHLFKSSILNVSIRKHTYQRSFLRSFISLYAPHLPRDIVQQAMDGVEGEMAQIKLNVPTLA